MRPVSKNKAVHFPRYGPRSAKAARTVATDGVLASVRLPAPQIGGEHHLDRYARTEGGSERMPSRAVSALQRSAADPSSRRPARERAVCAPPRRSAPVVTPQVRRRYQVAGLTRAIQFLEAKGYDVRSFAPWPNGADPQHPTFLLHVQPPVA